MKGRARTVSEASTITATPDSPSISPSPVRIPRPLHPTVLRVPVIW